MPTLALEQLPELMKAISYASIKIVTRCLIEWQLHTMVRPSEAAGAKWSEIDLKNKLWLIPAERMKKKREHTVPLTKQTIELLERLQPISGHREYLFPADRDPKKHTNEQTTKKTAQRTLPTLKFLMLILQHVLPKGLQRVRDYGLLSSGAKKLRLIIQLLLLPVHDWIKSTTETTTSPRAIRRCPCCQHKMHCIGITRMA